MSGQMDLSTPLNTSVVDEESLRALRAVQRMLPQGDGGSNGTLVGGTESAAGLGIGQGAPLGGGIAGLEGQPIMLAEDTSQTSSAAPEIQEAAATGSTSPADATAAFEEPIAPASTSSLAPSAPVTMTAALASPTATDNRSVSDDTFTTSSITSDTPDIQAPGGDTPSTPITPDNPDGPADRHMDNVADAPVVQAKNAEGLEDQAISLDLSAALTDTDGSEALSIRILGVPDGATLSHGTKQPDGSWVLDPADLSTLSITPPHDFSGTIELTMRVTSRESSTGATTDSEVSFRVQVLGVADAPDAAAANVSGTEDTAVALNLSAALKDVDGSETLSVSILGVPAGAVLSHGTKQADGSWSIDPADLSKVQITPPHDFSGTIDLTLRVTSRESVGGSTATTQVPFQVQIEAAADTPSLAVRDVSGSEDTPIALDLSSALADADGSETLHISIHGVPDGAVLSHGTKQPDGSWNVDASDLANLALTPPHDFSGSIELSVTATATEGTGGSQATTTSTFKVDVAAVADEPVLKTSDASGAEDATIPLDLSAALTDVDGSETLSVKISGIPAGASLSHGTHNEDGSWSVDPADLPHLAIAPPHDFSGTIDLTVTATSREVSNGSQASSESSFQVTVTAVADAPVVGARDVAGAEDSPIALNLSAALTDTDGSEALSVSILGVPEGATLSHGTKQPDGSWSVNPADLSQLALTPPHDFSGRIDLTLRATTTEGSNGASATTETGFAVQVAAVADAPSVTVADARGQEDQPISLTGLGGALSDTDGSESLSFVLSGVPAGAILSAGTRQADGSWSLTSADLAHLTLTPPSNFSGSLGLTLTAVSTEATDGQPSASTSASFTVGVDPVSDNATIGGSISGLEDSQITLKPTFTLADTDGSEVWSATAQVAGLPEGATLSRGTQVSPGVWEVSTDDLKGGLVKILPAANSDQDFTVTVTAVVTDTGNGMSVSHTVTGTSVVTVHAVADAPVVSASNVVGSEDQPVALNLSAALKDVDGSETLTVSLLGVPAGATLSHGTRQADGSWSVDPADLSHLTLTPPHDFSGTISLTLRATATEAVGNAQRPQDQTATKDVTFEVQVDGVADAPGVRVSAATGNEDTPIQLNVNAWVTDIDKSESITAIRIDNVPDGGVVRAGGVILGREADGSILVSPGAVGSLTITPPANSDQDFTLKVSAISAEPNGSTAESAPVDLSVTVRAVADAPVITSTGASGLEDSGIPLNLSATLPDSDGSEKLSFVVSGVPDGATLSVGTYRGPGTWSLTAEEAHTVVFQAPPDFSGTVNLKVTAVTQEMDGGSQASTTINFPVQVGAVVDTPRVGGLDGTSGNWGTMRGDEDKAIALNLDPGLTDKDGSEHVVGEILLGNVPAGAVLRLANGTVVAAGNDGLYHIDAAQMQGVTITLPANSDVAATLSVRMTIEDNGVRKDIGGQMVVDPLGDADMPVLNLAPSSGQGHKSADAGTGWIPLNISANLTDTDGSETLTMWVRDVPQGAVLSAGTAAGNGVWLVPVSALSTLSIRPALGYSGTFNLTVSAVSTEREGDQAVLTKSVEVTVTRASNGNNGHGNDADGNDSSNPGHSNNGDGTDDDGLPGNQGGQGPGNSVKAPTAQVPVVTVAHASGTEDHNVGLSISVAGADSDQGRETLSIRIAGVPEGARLSAGERDPLTGDWVLQPSQLANLKLTPPQDFAGTISLTVTGISTEATGSQATQSTRLDVAVSAVADGVSISAAPAAGLEDTPVPLNLKLTAGDVDGSEIVKSVLISGLPSGAKIVAGAGITDNGNGTWSVDPPHLSDVKVLAPANTYGTFSLTVAATVQEPTNGDTRTTTQAVSFKVAPDADAPVLTASAPIAGHEEGTVPLNITAALTDTDGSEVLSVVVAGLPTGARLSAGINNGDGSWTLTPSQFSGLTVAPPADWSGTMNLTVMAHSREVSNGSVATTEVPVQVQVDAVADAPVVGARDVAGAEDSPIALNLSAALTDTDGSEALSVSILGVPEGASLSHGVSQGGGLWQVAAQDLHDLHLTPAPNWNGTLHLSMQAVSTEADSGHTASTSVPFSVTVTPVNDAPDLALTAAPHVFTGAHHAEAFGAVQATDIDSEHIGGATIALVGAQPGDKLDLEGFTLHNESGRVLVGDTGIEIVGGGFAGASGSLTLTGNATPETYAEVLKSIVLESSDPAGLGSGSRSISVTLVDSEGAASTKQTVDVVVDDLQPQQPEHALAAAALSEPIQEASPADLLLTLDDGSSIHHGAAGAWTDHANSEHSSAAEHHLDLHLPVAEQHGTMDDFQTDLSKVHWS